MARFAQSTPFQKYYGDPVSGLRYILHKSPTENQLKLWFRAFYPGSENTANRRFTTFMNYLRYVDLLTFQGNKIKLKKYIGSVVKKSVPPSQGLEGGKPKHPQKTPPSVAMKGNLKYDVDAQKCAARGNIDGQAIVDEDICAIAPDPCADQETAVYRHFDTAGTLLYVRISLSALHRLGQHRQHAHWFKRISRVEIEQLPTRAAAEDAEQKAIACEFPLYNMTYKNTFWQTEVVKKRMNAAA